MLLAHQGGNTNGIHRKIHSPTPSFPITFKQRSSMTKRLSSVHKASGFNKMKRSLALRIEVSSLLRGRIMKEFPVQGYWKDHMSIAADCERRRKDWLSVGGVPRHHQYMVAFAGRSFWPSTT
ncbi:hypothetical protein BDN71DRAFT_618793 [Pleurotus eryngii]|uniref:Uncharacterized protein n=1 Tax=Pleurotus eryngii TaxID=5323 RepID=A0A9P6D8E8_PLEER|nr:hypothetical protein BDN71DRAFT_618793 [Pleurotus eryngii]